MRGTIVAQQWMVIYFLVCKPIYLSIVEVKRLCKNNKVKDMWLGGMCYQCCPSGFNKGVSGIVFLLITAEQLPIQNHASLWAWEQTSSPSFCASSSPALGTWVKWPWSRRSQASRGLLMPFGTIDCWGRWQSLWHGPSSVTIHCKLDDFSEETKTLSLAIEFSCTASKRCK